MYGNEPFTMQTEQLNIPAHFSSIYSQSFKTSHFSYIHSPPFQNFCVLTICVSYVRDTMPVYIPGLWHSEKFSHQNHAWLPPRIRDICKHMCGERRPFSILNTPTSKWESHIIYTTYEYMRAYNKWFTKVTFLWSWGTLWNDMIFTQPIYAGCPRVRLSWESILSAKCGAVQRLTRCIHTSRAYILPNIYIAHSRNQVTCGAHLYVWNAIKLSLNVASTTPPVQSSAVQSLAPTYICECENMATQEEGLLWIWCRQNEWAHKKHTQKLCPYGS